MHDAFGIDSGKCGGRERRVLVTMVDSSTSIQPAKHTPLSAWPALAAVTAASLVTQRGRHFRGVTLLLS